LTAVETIGDDVLCHDKALIRKITDHRISTSERRDRRLRIRQAKDGLKTIALPAGTAESWQNLRPFGPGPPSVTARIQDDITPAQDMIM
jgi:hypothetical protein